MKDKVAVIWKFVLIIIRNKYLVAVSFFVLWVTFLDTYNLLDRFEHLQDLNALKKEIDYYKNEISVYKTQYNELFSSKSNLEKFAREQYLMKEENEDLFIIISD
ncbi:MAG TPA: septum formation initiator family protein [Bacteroidales bacterium]|nr:septum formation initiator family protein [Bacteroidales bacterium]